MVTLDFGKLEEALSYIRSEVGSDFACSQFHILVVVASRAGITQHELGLKLNMLHGTVSRNIRALGKYLEDYQGTKVVKGYDLVRMEPDLYERRRMACYLTTKGEKVMKTLAAILK
jgi:DNA-binding MarR family transcriptional regulator